MLGVQKATIVRVKGIDVLNSKEYDKETFNLTEHIEDEESSLVDQKNKFLKS